MSQNGPKTTSLMTSLTRNPQHPIPKFFFRVQARRLADPFEPLNSSLAQSAEELWRWWDHWKLLFLGRNLGTNILYTGSQNVNFEISLKWNSGTFC